MSRVPELIDALVAALRADEGLAGVVVTDGPEVTAGAVPDWIVVGFDGDGDGDFQAASSVQDWASLGTDRTEQFQLTVAVIALRGDTDVKAARDRVYALAAPVRALLWADPSLGLPSLQVGVGAAQLSQVQTEQGVQAVLLLTLAGEAFT
ncbi:hypothetical protein [Streptomyces fimicarius]|uniref:hypothetical protein n=1 Tax=Streptomyces TaxID=1883 RepID=UPI00367B1344